MSAFHTIGSIARNQHGLITIEQIVRAGITPTQLDYLVRRGSVIPVRRRVYRLSGVPISWRQAVLAAVFAGGPDTVASHSTAGVLWELKPMPRSGGPLHVTAPRQVRLKGVRAHIVALSTGEKRVRDGIRVTSVERTILDLGSTLTVVELGQCVDDALRRRLLRLDRLRALVDSDGRGHGRVFPLRQVLADRLAGYNPGGSDWEQNMDRLWDELGLPPARRQFPVTANGHHYILDRALPDLKIGVEWNGFTSHGTRSAFDHDSDRRADLTSAGWHMVDFTSRSTPERLVAAVQGAIRTRTGGRINALGVPVMR